MNNHSSSNRSTKTGNQSEVARLLDAQADELTPPASDERLTRRIMQRVIGVRRAPPDAVSGWPAMVPLLWMGGGITAAALVLAILIVPNRPDSSEELRFQIPTPVQLDRPLAAREQALNTELEQIGSDLHHLVRLASIRLELDPLEPDPPEPDPG